MSFCGEVERGPVWNRLDFGDDPDQDLNPGIFSELFDEIFGSSSSSSSRIFMWRN